MQELEITKELRTAVPSFCRAWKPKYFSRMELFSQPHWCKSFADPEQVLQNMFTTQILGTYEVDRAELPEGFLSTGVLCDVFVDVRIRYATGKWGSETRVFRCIRENPQGTPDVTGKWYVNPSSVARRKHE